MALANTTAAGKSGKTAWYVDREETSRSSSHGLTPAMESAIKAIRAAKMDAASREAAIRGITGVGAKPFTLVISDPTATGRISLVKVAAGTCKAKQLSPTLLRHIANNAEFLLRYLDEFCSVEQQGAEE